MNFKKETGKLILPNPVLSPQLPLVRSLYMLLDDGEFTADWQAEDEVEPDGLVLPLLHA